MKPSQVFRKNILYLVRAFCFLSLVLSCTPSGIPVNGTQHCGSGRVPAQLNGLFWLLGEPASANVLCTVQNSEFLQVLVLEPDSRDPLLFEDELTGRILLIERFSGDKARPSRATWFSSEGAQLTQFGDWPQNTYAALRLSENEGLATGFDLGQIRHFLMARESVESLGKLTDKEQLLSAFNPIVALRNGSWFAFISSGFDLTTFSAKEAQVLRVREGGPSPDGLVSIADETESKQCKNAFQAIQLTNSRVVLSCNPQYFGPDGNELVAVFEAELMTNGELKMRNLHSESGADVQRIDLLGQTNSNEIILGMKVTTTDDYIGQFVRTATLSLDDLQLTDFDDARGPFTTTKFGQPVVFCVADSRLCKNGELFLKGTGTNSVFSLDPGFGLPFLSFPTRINLP